MMFSDPQAGMAFRTLKDKLSGGTPPQKIMDQLNAEKQ